MLEIRCIFGPRKKVYLVLGCQQVKLKDLIKIRSRSARSSSPVFNPDALLALGFPRQDKAVATIASPDVTFHCVDVTIENNFLTNSWRQWRSQPCTYRMDQLIQDYHNPWCITGELKQYNQMAPGGKALVSSSKLCGDPDLNIAAPTTVLLS